MSVDRSFSENFSINLAGLFVSGFRGGSLVVANQFLLLVPADVDGVEAPLSAALAGANRLAVAVRNDLAQMYHWAEKRQPWRRLLAEGNPIDVVDIKTVVDAMSGIDPTKAEAAKPAASSSKGGKPPCINQ